MGSEMCIRDSGFQDGAADGEGEGAFEYVADVDVHGGGSIIIWGGVFLRKDDKTELIVS